MARFVCRAALAGLVLVFPALLAPSAYAAAPKIALSQPDWDFGQVWHGDHPTLVLTVQNIGDADLLIKEVKTSCGCTAAQPEKKQIPPGDATTIKVVFDTNGKQGAVDSKVMIFSNDPRSGPELGNKDPNPNVGEVQFSLKGFVKRAIVRTPLGGIVIRSRDGQPGQAGKLKLENQMPEPMKLELVRNGLQETDVEIKELEPGRIFEVYARTNKPLPPRTHIRGDLEFKTGLQREPSFIANARIEIVGSVEASPPAFLLRPQDKKLTVRPVQIQYYGDDPNGFRLTEFKCANDKVQISLGPTTPPPAWLRNPPFGPPVTAVAEARIQFPTVDVIPPGEGTLIEIKTSDPQTPVLEVLLTQDKAAFDARMHGKVSGSQ